MDILNSRPDKPEIHYPCQWTYTVIGVDEDSIKKAARDVCEGKVYNLEHSNNSRKGNYVSYQLVVVVNSYEERKEYFNRLKNHKSLKMVI